MDDWWDTLLPESDSKKPIGPQEMLRVIAYDITDAKRLHRIALICEDFGLRVQYSVFECWLDEPNFQKLWSQLEAAISPKQDRLVAYTLDAGAVRKRKAAGHTMVLSQKSACYYY